MIILIQQFPSLLKVQNIGANVGKLELITLTCRFPIGPDERQENAWNGMYKNKPVWFVENFSLSRIRSIIFIPSSIV